MPRSVCILGSGSMASNPRLLKEAGALHEAGYDVTTVSCDYTDALRATDDEIERAVPWRVRRVSRPSLARYATRAARVAARLVEAAGIAPPSGLAAEAYGGPTRALSGAVAGVAADLYIAHYVPSLPAAAAAARRRGALLAYDAEDFHSGEGAGSAEDDLRMRMVGRIEGAALPACAYVSAASPLIGRAYAERYGIATPATILNVFPLAMKGAGRAEHAGVPLRAYWFSQTIGLDRGLQAFIRAMARAATPVTLDIRGSNRWGHGDTLLALARELGIEGRVKLLPLAPPDEMVRLAADYDLGLSLETDVTVSRSLCLTNKIFTYLLAGVPVMLSDTPGQRALAPDLGAAAVLVSLGDVDGIAATLDRLAPALAAAKAAAERLGRERYNWDREKHVLLEAVDAAFARRGGARA
ncbi:MAG: glycosyltransferase [Proteobacteria bacterium]|nr:glycosyltransferase [Pseudomonadota bacterium]